MIKTALTIAFSLQALLLAACAAPAAEPVAAEPPPTSIAPTGGEEKAAYLAELESYYGAPSQAGFGSAVFTQQVASADALEEAAQAQYQTFVGDKWEERGPQTWLGPWKEVYRRAEESEHDIVAELRAIDDFEAQMQVAMILDNIDNAEQARQALAVAYDDPAMNDVRAYMLGDGDARSGLRLAGRHVDGQGVFLVFLRD